MPDLVGKRKWFFLLSALVILPGIISIIAFGFRTGIEFSSGSTMTLVFKESASMVELREVFTEAGRTEAILQHTPKDALLFRTEALDDEGERKLADGLKNEFPAVRIARFTVQAPQPGPEEEPAPQMEEVALLLGEKEVEQERLKAVMETLGYQNVALESRRLDSFYVRTSELRPAEEQEITEALDLRFGGVDVLDFYSISPVIATERVRYTVIAVAVAAVGILLFITWAFRRVTNSIRFGVCAILALVHDALVVAGIFSLLRIEIDSMFIIAVLTVIGYSVNDTIVVFDRIRENLIKEVGGDFPSTVNASLVQTLGRSLNTGLTTLFVLLALYLFGGATISNFVLALIIGIVAGTYSSIGIASQLLVTWERGDFGRMLRRVPLPGFMLRRAS